jgi:Glycosyltransferase family 87
MARPGIPGDDLRPRSAPPARLAMLAGSATVLVTAGLAGGGLSFLSKAACRAGAWNIGIEQYQAHCYTDIYPLYFTERLSAGKIPYLGHPVEYPVLIGAAMQAAAWVVQPISDAFLRGREFFDVTAVLLVIFAVAAVLATAYLAGPARRWTALLVALSPAVILAAFINWDLIAMSLATLGLAAWAGRRGVLAGILLGLAVATKFYPVFLLGPLFLLCLRAGRLRACWVTAGSAAAAWLAVNLPVALAAPGGWAEFYRFNAARGADWGSIWYFFETEHWPVLGSMPLGTVNVVSLALFGIACAGVGVLALAAPRRPRLPQLCFLVIAAFLLFNKVWSPQYVIWLAPLVVLARPRLLSYAFWQLAEIAYFLGIWAYLITIIAGPAAAGGIGPWQYFLVLLTRFAAVLLLSGLVIRDILDPRADVVRRDGDDDPAGGVLADAADRFVLRLSAGLRQPRAVGGTGPTS